MAASATVAPRSPRMRAARGVLRLSRAIRFEAIWNQWPGGVTVPAPSAQKRAIARWVGVALEEIRLTSSSSVWNWADPNAGGGPGRSWLADVMIQVFQVPASGSTGLVPCQKPGPV